ncbi:MULTISPECIES: hypothetical protein [Paracoccus]|uniref:hypothetical protein n=1 Tax=Paracoccus TaxID=265 RepID=UPI001FB5C218|nr:MULTISPECIES: hypothetical protein [Paracoccus]MCJ1903021.1 hypothetical protein [Paracoccus versutus]MDF3907492.1 hypothetical protein [Paracoccus sp. AS002]
MLVKSCHPVPAGPAAPPPDVLSAPGLARSRRLLAVIAGRVAKDGIGIHRDHGAAGLGQHRGLLSSNDFGRAAKGGIPKTWSDRVGAKAGARFSNTPSGGFLDDQPRAGIPVPALTDRLGHLPLVETVAIRGIGPLPQEPMGQAGRL